MTASNADLRGLAATRQRSGNWRGAVTGPVLAASLLVSGVCAGGALVSGAALAQGSSGPLQLLPGSISRPATDPTQQPVQQPSQQPTGRPAVQFGAPSASSSSPASSPGSGGGQGSLREGIDVSDLAVISPEALGTLTADRGGFANTMWTGTSRDVAVRLLAALPLNASSPARQDVVRRLLLTSAQPPAGGSQPSLLDLRLSALMTLGATDSVRMLAKGITGQARTESVDRAVVDTLLVDNRVDEACALAEGGLAAYPSPYWQKVAAFCLFRAGKVEQANVQVTLLREQKLDDPAFLWAAEQMSGLRVLPLKGFQSPSPLTVAMIRETGRPYPTGTLVDAAPWLARAVAAGTKTDPSVRFAAGQRAVLTGSLSGSELATLYASVGFNEADYARQPADLVADADPKTAAVLYQMVMRQTTGQARAEWVVRAWDQATRQGQALVAAQVYAPVVRDVLPDPAQTWFVPTAVRILAAAGQMDDAARWVALAEDMGRRGDASASKLLESLWLLRRLMASSGLTHWTSQEYDGWRSALTQTVEANAAAVSGGKDPAPTTRLVQKAQGRGIALLQATGEVVSADLWAPLWSGPAVDEAPAPPASRMQVLDSAVQTRRLAEGIGLSLMVLGDAAPAAGADIAVAEAVSALRHLGFDGLSRRIAVEAAVAGGL